MKKVVPHFWLKFALIPTVFCAFGSMSVAQTNAPAISKKATATLPKTSASPALPKPGASPALAVDGHVPQFEQTVQYSNIDLDKSLKPKVVILLDGSGSMGQLLDKQKSKMWWSKKLFKAYMSDQWREKADVGMIVYGSRRKKDCGDIYMAFKPGERNLSKIEKSIETLEPTGMTPIADSLQMAINELKNYPGPKRIMIFTDGEETCGGNSCKLLEDAIQNKIVDLEMFVTGIGMKEDSKDLDGLRCLGKTFGADSPQSLNQSLNDIHNASHGGPKGVGSNNLLVEAPNPNAEVRLYQLVNGVSQYIRSFKAANGVKVPPGEYSAEVLLDPIYKFPKFVIPPKKRVTLRVEGVGTVHVKFFDRLLDVQLLNKDKKAVYTSTSDVPIVAKAGVYDVKISGAPFFEQIEPKYKITPGSDQEINIDGVGVLQMDYPTTVGLYVYNSADVVVGNYLTNAPFLLKNGSYRIFVNENCNLPSVQVDNAHSIKVLNCNSNKK
jgi:Ca-activated chloride channel family protein